MSIDTTAELRTTRISSSIAAPRPWIVLAVMLAVGTLIRVAVAASTEGTNDVYSWLAFIDASRSEGAFHLYGITEWPTVPVFDFNHGPLVALGVRVAAWIQDTLSIGELVLPRLPAIAADAGSTVLVYVFVTRKSGPRRGLLMAAMVAFNPVLILVSGFHGNTDPVFVALVLLAIVLLDRDLGTTAGMAFAAAIAVKIVPLVAAPAIVLSIRTPGVRRQFVRATLIVSTALWLPAVLLDPGALIREVFLYRGIPGIWGVGWLASGVDGDLADTWLRELWTILVVAAVLASGWVLAKRGSGVSWSIAAAFLVFLAMAPGFGVQYLAWPVLFLLVAAPGFGAVYSAAAGSFLFATYAFWSGGGWSLGFANAWAANPLWSPGMESAKQLLWILVAVLAYLMHRRRAGRGSSPSERMLWYGFGAGDSGIY